MASHITVTLPSLHTKGPYPPIPRRYEETKPAIVQSFTHMKIMDVGSEIHRRTLEMCDKECEEKVRKAEVAVWEEAELVKQEALRNAAQKAKAEQEKVIKKLNKVHEKTVKEACLRVQGEMQKLALEQVQQERVEGEERLRAAVSSTEERCHRELLAAVQQAREEERAAAADRAAVVARQNKAHLDAALRAAADEKQRALLELKETMQEQQEKAVAQARQKEQAVAKKQLAEMQKIYEDKIDGLNGVIKKHEDNIASLVDQISALIRKKKRLEKELKETREEFQNFINNTNPYEKGESDYVLPPSKSLDISE